MMEKKCDPESTLDPWVLSVCRGGAKMMPTVDAVEVIRCRDCKHHHYQNGIPYCDKYYWGWKDDDFCSYGVRKDGGDEQTKKPE